MEIYILTFFVLLMLSFRGIGKRGLLLVVLYLSIILGFRSREIGVDTTTYIDYYNGLLLNPFLGYMEIGFNTVAVLCKLLGLSAYGFNFVVAFLSLISYYFVLVSFGNKKINGYGFFLVYSLGFYFLMFNGMRQFLAMSIVLIGYNQLSKGKVVSFFLIILLASTIHMATLCAAIMYLAYKITFTNRKVFLILLLSYLIGLFAGEHFFVGIAGRYAGNVEQFGLRSGVLYSLTVGLMTNIFFYWLYKCIPSLSKNYWIKFNLFSVVILNIMSNLVIGPRIVFIFSMVSVIALSLYMNKAEWGKIVKPLAYLYAIVTFARVFIPEILGVGTDGNLVPYNMQFVFFE